MSYRIAIILLLFGAASVILSLLVAQQMGWKYVWAAWVYAIIIVLGFAISQHLIAKP